MASMASKWCPWILGCAAAAFVGCGKDAASGTAMAPVGSAGTSGSPAAAGTGGLPASGSAGGSGSAGMLAPSAGAPGAGSGGAGAMAPTPMAGAGAGAGAGQAGSGGTTDAGAPDTACDRSCLLGILQGYIDALLARDPSRLTVSADLKYTENGVAAELGETVWQTAMSLVPEARLDFADPQEGQVASQFVFNEASSSPVIYQVRLKVEELEITEIESMAVRQADAANGFFNVQNMKPEPVFLEAIEPAARMTRDELIAITNLYLDYLEGQKSGSEVPFDDGCKRYENGFVTANGLASFSFQSWAFELTRRILVVDEEAGITWGMFPFQQSETALVVGEAFKIIDGKIRMIQAVMAYQPSKAWD